MGRFARVLAAAAHLRPKRQVEMRPLQLHGQCPQACSLDVGALVCDRSFSFDLSMTITKHVDNTPRSRYPGTGSRASRHPRSGSYSIVARTPPRFFSWRVHTLCDCAVLHVSSPTVSEPKEITINVDSLQLTATTLQSHTSYPSRACGGRNTCLESDPSNVLRHARHARSRQGQIAGCSMKPAPYRDPRRSGKRPAARRAGRLAEMQPVRPRSLTRRRLACN